MEIDQCYLPCVSGFFLESWLLNIYQHTIECMYVIQYSKNCLDGDDDQENWG